MLGFTKRNPSTTSHLRRAFAVWPYVFIDRLDHGISLYRLECRPMTKLLGFIFLRGKWGETVSMDDSIRFKCPICGALPNDACVRTDGTLTPGPHRGRKSVAPGAKPVPRQDFSQAATRAVREATDGK